MKSLIWKEWRESRLLYLFAFLVIIILAFTFSSWRDRTTICVAFVFLAVAVGVFSHSGELTRHTDAFLYSRPLSQARVFWIKYLLHLAFILSAYLLITSLIFLQAREFISSRSPLLPRPSYGRFLEYITVDSCLAQILVAAYSLGVCSGLFFRSALAFIASPVVAILICSSGILLTPCILTISSLPAAYAVSCFIFSILAAIFAFVIWQSYAKGIPVSKQILYVWLGCFAASLVINLVVTIYMHHRFLAAVEQARKEGFKMSLQEINLPGLPDDRNAAVIYEKAFALADQLKQQYPCDWSKRASPSVIFDQDHPIILEMLSDDRASQLFALIEQAVIIPQCRFQIVAEGDAFLSARLPHLVRIRTLALLNASRTMQLIRQKCYPAAVSSAITGLKIGDALVNESTVISQLVRVYVDKVGVDSFQLLMAAFPETRIGDARETLAVVARKNRRLTIGIEGELAGFMSFFRTNSAGLISMHVAAHADRLRYARICDPVLRPLYWHQSFEYMNRMKEFINALRTNNLSSTEALDRKIIGMNGYSPVGRVRNSFSMMMLPALFRIGIQQATFNVKLDELTIALALRLFKSRNGCYPADLSALTPSFLAAVPGDPFSKNGTDGYHYHREGNGFIIYSVGENKKDDKGLCDMKTDDISFKVPD